MQNGYTITEKSELEISIPLNQQNLLIEFAHRHLNFQLAELESVLHKNEINYYEKISLPSTITSERKDRAFLILSFPWTFWRELTKETTKFTNSDDAIISVLSQCLLIRSVTELWGIGATMEECIESVKKQYEWELETKQDRFLMHPYFATSNSWKMTIHTFGCKFTREQQNEMRAKFSFLPMLGPVKMENPTNEYLFIREIKVTAKGSPVDVLNPRPDAIAVYFGRLIRDASSSSCGNKARNWRAGRLNSISLKRRKYLGPTSMDAELSMIMSSIAKVKPGSFCFDPFVGTGSLLLSCALHGGFCFGTDLDIRVLRGIGKEDNIFTNFDQYNLPRPEIVRSDNSIYNRHFQNSPPLYDAIVCDPPYGIRAGARQSGTRRDEVIPVSSEFRYDHIAQTKPYPVSDVMTDLLDLAAQVLLLHGRLVYIIPSMNDFDIEADLPKHPCLIRRYCCYQPLQTNLGRSVVCMEKTVEYDESLREYYRNNIWLNGAESAEKIVNLRERLLEEAKKRPGYEEKAEYRRKKRKELKKERKQAKV